MYTLFKQSYKVTALFGDRINPITKKKEFHNGIDIAVPAGTAIFAPFQGAGESFLSPAGGLSFYLYNANMRLGFAHLSKLSLKPYNLYLPGDILCYSGNTGQSTGPHLHFTVYDYQKKSYLNPVEFFKFQL